MQLFIFKTWKTSEMKETHMNKTSVNDTVNLKNRIHTSKNTLLWSGEFTIKNVYFSF